MRKLLATLLILACAPAYATNPAFVGSTFAGGNVTTITRTAAACGAQCNDLILVIDAAATGTINTVTDSVSGALTADFVYAGGFGVYRIHLATAVSHTVTIAWTTAPSHWELTLFEVSNVGGVDTGAGTISVNSATSASWVTESLSPAASGDFMVAAFYAASASLTSLALSTNFTAQVAHSTAGPAYVEGYLATAASGAQTMGATASGSTAYTGAWVAYIGATTVCTDNGWASNGTWAVPNGTSGSYWLANGTFGTPDCATIKYWTKGGNMAVN